MALRIEWSPEAIEDVEDIAEYISRDSDFYAREIILIVAVIHGKRLLESITERFISQE